jgi:hypothetical protein
LRSESCALAAQYVQLGFIKPLLGLGRRTERSALAFPAGQSFRFLALGVRHGVAWGHRHAPNVKGMSELQRSATLTPMRPRRALGLIKRLQRLNDAARALMS